MRAALPTDSVSLPSRYLELARALGGSLPTGPKPCILCLTKFRCNIGATIARAQVRQRCRGARSRLCRHCQIAAMPHCAMAAIPPCGMVAKPSLSGNAVRITGEAAELVAIPPRATEAMSCILADVAAAHCGRGLGCSIGAFDAFPVGRFLAQFKTGRVGLGGEVGAIASNMF